MAIAVSDTGSLAAALQKQKTTALPYVGLGAVNASALLSPLNPTLSATQAAGYPTSTTPVAKPLSATQAAGYPTAVAPAPAAKVAAPAATAPPATVTLSSTAPKALAAPVASTAPKAATAATAPIAKAAPVAPTAATAKAAPPASVAPAAATAVPARDISAELMKATPGSDAYNALLAERYAKVQADPTLAAKYGNDQWSTQYLASQGTPSEAAPNTSPAGTVVTDTMAQQSSLASQYQQVEAQQAAARQALVAAVQKVASPENFQSMLSAALAQMMPQYEVQKQEIADQYTELGRKLDINQEQRGVYSAEFSADQYRKQQATQARDLAAALATIQSNAVGETRQNIAQQLSALGMQGDWQTADATRALQGYGTQADVATAMGQLGLSERGQNIQQSQFTQEYALDRAALAQDQNQFDATMKFNQAELDQNATQWASEMDFKALERQDALEQFTKRMGLDYAQLGVSQASQAADAAYRAASLALDQQQFNTEQERQAAYDAQDELEFKRDVFSAMYSGYKTDADAGLSSATIASNLNAFAEMYRNDPIYPELKTFISNTVGGKAAGGMGR